MKTIGDTALLPQRLHGSLRRIGVRGILFHMKLSSHQWVLFIIFVVTLPFVNPWVRGDGVGYYAYVRALLVERHLSFENDWRLDIPLRAASLIVLCQ